MLFIYKFACQDVDFYVVGHYFEIAVITIILFLYNTNIKIVSTIIIMLLRYFEF